MAMQGASMPTTAKALGHGDVSSTAIYARIADQTAQDAVDAVVARF